MTSARVAKARGVPLSRSNRWVRLLVRVGTLLVAFYILACAVSALTYRRLLYPAPIASPAMPPDATLVNATAADGAPVFAWRFGRAPAKVSDVSITTVAFFHGNGETIADNVELARALVARGISVLLVEYRGYGISKAAGRPTEDGLYADAAAALQALGAAPKDLVLMGFSLGTGVATEMVTRGYGRAMVLVAPYTSIPDVGAKHFPVLPVRYLVRDRFDTASKAAQVSAPVLVIQGDADEVVPFDMGEELAHTFPHGKLIAINGGHHTDLFARDDHLVDKIVSFVEVGTP